MAVQGFFLSHLRNQVIDHSVAYFQESTTILIPAPIEESRLFACVRPFQWHVINNQFSCYKKEVLYYIPHTRIGLDRIVLRNYIILTIIIWLSLNLPNHKMDQTETPSLKEVYFFVWGMLLTQC